MRGRGQAISRALGAFVLLGVLAFGVPFMLVTLVGNPLPSELPSVDETRILLTQNGDGFTNFVLAALAILIWWIWAQLIVALVVEVVATVRQTETRRLPTLPGIQAFAARLVATITLAATLAAGPVLAPAVGALTFSDPVAGAALAALTIAPTELAPAVTPTTGSISLTPADQNDALAGGTSLVVSDHTELWDLADAAYGDGVSWKLIALTNAGLVDANGAMITNESETVAPGTELILPGTIDTNAASAFGSIVTDTAVTDAVHIVEPGDSMWTVAESEVERRLEGLEESATPADVADYWTQVVGANQDVASGDVDLIYPGERLVLPGAVDRPDSASAEAASEPMPFSEIDRPGDNRIEPAGPAPESPADETAAEELPADEAAMDVPEAPAAPAPRGPSTPAAPVAPAEPAASDGRAVSPSAVGLAAFGGAVLSAGIVGAVRRRRDLQRRTRPEHTVARPASTEAAAFEAALAHASDEIRSSRHGVGWTMLPAATVNAMRTSGPVEIHASDDGSFAAVTAVNDGTTWAARRVDLQTTQDEALAQSPEVEAVKTDDSTEGPAAPTTIVVGTDPSSNEAVLLDLASAGLVALEGDTSSVRRFVRSVILDLAVSERADDLCVIAVSTANELENLERVRCVSAFSEAHAHVLRSGHAASDSLTPIIVVADSSPDADDASVQAMRKLGVIVVAPGLDATVSVELDGDRGTLSPTGTSVVLAALDNADYRCVTELIENTGSAAMELDDDSITVDDILDVASAAERVAEPGPIDVKILGPVEITGAESFSSLKAVDVVSYLAFHRHGVDADQIKTWVWPTFDPPTDKAFANVMSRARTGLGASEDGAPYLSRAGADKTYRLSEAVTTDFDRFRAIVDAADEATDTAGTLELLREALELIRGVPFTGGAASSFTWADNHVRARVEYTIDETVHRCADLALEIGDLATARWAALKGLELVPGCEQCFKRRFLVAGAGNNRTELRRAMADLEASAMADLGEPEAVDTISGELLDLYNELDQALVAGSV